MLHRIIQQEFHFKDKEQVRMFFTRLTGLCKNLNYAKFHSDEYKGMVQQIEDLIENPS